MPKQKQFLKDMKDMKDSKKKGKRPPPVPETADDFLAIGVDFEEAGEKWRGGDAVKSTRFFIRAIECYDDALKKFPMSFDLAYNKARVQYELTQHPKLLSQLPGPLLDLLATALESSRFALKLKKDNADVLFNTAQILTSLAEALGEAPTNDSEPFPLLEEALGLFQRCLAVQEQQHAESIAQAEAMPEDLAPSIDTMSFDPEDGEGGVALTQTPMQDDRWATIIEPVTNDTLLDTVLAQLECLTTLASLLPPDSANPLTWIEEYSAPLVNSKLADYLAGVDGDRLAEAALTRANFIASISDASFRAQRIDATTYLRALDEAFTPLDLIINPGGLVNKAEAYITYNATLDHHTPLALDSRWKALTAALASVTAASKLPSASNLSKIHLLRGDCELFRWQLGVQEYELARKNEAVLRGNAEKFYRGAGALARSGGVEGEALEAGVKEALVSSQ